MKDPLLDKVLGGRFQLRSRIGEGGMSVVYLARDSVEGGEAAVKILHRHLIDSEEFVARFEQEARTAGRLTHPSAVKIVDSGLEDGLPYIAMEYCGGRSLKRIIREEAPLDVGRAADLASQILDALTAAHEIGIIHRDLKPENVRVSVQGGREVVKVLDFGIAKFVGSEKMKEMTGAIKTRTGIVFGTPKYMAPEQIMGEEIDSRIDVYAAGVILYEMLTGFPPFESEDLYGYVTKHLHQPAPPLREKAPDLEIPDDLERLVLRSLSKEKEARPRDAGSLVAELSPFVVRQRASRLRQYGAGAGGLLLGGAVGAAGAYELGAQGPGLEIAVAAAALGVAAAGSFLAFGRTATRNLLLRILIVLVVAAVAEGVLWLIAGGDGVANAAAALLATFVFVAFSFARGLGARWWRPVVGCLGGAAAGALFPVAVAGGYRRLWQIESLDGRGTAALAAAAALGLAFGLGGMLVSREAPRATATGRPAQAPEAVEVAG